MKLEIGKRNFGTQLSGRKEDIRSGSGKKDIGMKWESGKGGLSVKFESGRKDIGGLRRIKSLMFLVDILLMSCASMASADSNKPSINVIIIIPKKQVVNQTHMRQDIERIEKEANKHLRGHKLNLRMIDIVKTSHLIGEVTNTRRAWKKEKTPKQIHAILAPCHYDPGVTMVRLGTSWKVPVISPCLSFIKEKKKKTIEEGIEESFSYLVRVGDITSKMLKVRNALDAQFGWEETIYMRPTRAMKTRGHDYGRYTGCEFSTANRNIPDNEDTFRKTIGDQVAVTYFCGTAGEFIRFLDKAYQLGYGNGHYTFIFMTPVMPINETFWRIESEAGVNLPNVRKMLKFVMNVKSEGMRSHDLRTRSLEEKEWRGPSEEIYEGIIDGFELVVDIFATYLEQGATVASIKNNFLQHLSDGGYKTFTSSRRIEFDNLRDRVINYSLYDYNSDLDRMQKVLRFEETNDFTPNSCKSASDKCESLPGIEWGTKNNEAHPWKPECAAWEDCDAEDTKSDFPEETLITGLLLGALCICIISIVVGLICRRKKRRFLRDDEWLITSHDLKVRGVRVRQAKNVYRNSIEYNTSRSSVSDKENGLEKMVRSLSRTAAQQSAREECTVTFKGQRVWSKPVPRLSPINCSKKDKEEMWRIKQLSPNFVVPFVGAIIDPPSEACIISQYCSRKSLKELLENHDMKMELKFKFSLIWDLLSGLNYLHHSDLQFHGNLKSTNCLLDSRFVLRLSGFGPKYLLKKSRTPFRKDAAELTANASKRSSRYFPSRASVEIVDFDYSKMLWTAPELLWKQRNGDYKGYIGAASSDIYSLGIIMQEILLRKGTFAPLEYGLLMDAEEIVISLSKEKGMLLLDPFTMPLRPWIEADEISVGEGDKLEAVHPSMVLLVKSCWYHDEAHRPDVSTIIKALSSFQPRGSNLMEDAMHRMEQYTKNLEGLVEEKTRDYLEEKKKVEEFVHSLLPVSIATQLLSGNGVVKPEKFDCVTIYFSDIVNFSALQTWLTPLEVIEILNLLFVVFDRTIERYDVFKAENISGAYIVVSGLPVRNGDKHAFNIANMALELRKAMKSFRVPSRPSLKLQMKIGVHSGPVVAGVIGSKVPKYTLYGDTMNLTARMQSSCPPDKIQASSDTERIIGPSGRFHIESRGTVDVKGKGEMETFFLEEKSAIRNGAQQKGQ